MRTKVTFLLTAVTLVLFACSNNDKKDKPTPSINAIYYGDAPKKLSKSFVEINVYADSDTARITPLRVVMKEDHMKNFAGMLGLVGKTAMIVEQLPFLKNVYTSSINRVSIGSVAYISEKDQKFNRVIVDYSQDELGDDCLADKSIQENDTVIYLFKGSFSDLSIGEKVSIQ